jgi:hypothetical protein
VSAHRIDTFIKALTNNRGIPSWCGGVLGLVASFTRMSNEHHMPTSIEIDRKGGGFSCYARPASLRLTEDKIILPITPKYKPKVSWSREQLARMLEDLVEEMEAKSA